MEPAMSHCLRCTGTMIRDTDGPCCINCGWSPPVVVPPELLTRKSLNQEHYDPGLTKHRPKVGAVGLNHYDARHGLV